MKRHLPMVFVLAAFLAAPAYAGWNDFLKDMLGGDKQETKQQQTATSSLTNSEMNAGVLDALAVGVKRAIDLLGKDGGYLNDQLVRIAMPDHLKTVEKGLRAVGQDKYADEFIETMNHAAEKAVPLTVDIFMESIRKMSVTDAREIVTGPDDSATRYFRRTSGEQLGKAIKPIITDATSKAGVTKAYKNMVNRMDFMGGYVDLKSWDLDQYVTDKALDGLFLKLAQEEKNIRHNPVARTTDILKKVFGGMVK